MSPGELTTGAIGQTVDPLGRLILLILTIGILLGLAGVSGLVAVLLTRIARLERAIEELVAHSNVEKARREEAEKTGN
jgi:hypothetical protein